MCTFITVQVHKTCWVRGKKKGKKNTFFLIWTIKYITFFLWLCRILCQSRMADGLIAWPSLLRTLYMAWSTHGQRSGMGILCLPINLGWIFLCHFWLPIILSRSEFHDGVCVISVIESSHYDLGPVLRVGQVFEKVKTWTWRKSLWVLTGHVWNSKLGRK